MILTVDVGNSNIVLGGVRDDEIVFEARLRTDATKTSDEYCIDLKIILEVYKLSAEDIEGSIIASVVPQVLNSMQTAIRKLTGKAPLVVGPELKTGLHIAIDNPAQAGADLVVGCVAALREHPAPMIIIDMGTASTVSVIDANGCFLGGVIAAGVRLTLKALCENTAQLPAIDIEAPRSVIGSNTVDSMKSGLVFGTAAMLDGLLDRIEEELGEEATVVATGGLSKEIIAHCHRHIIYNENLLLDGLREIYEKNR